eukprot:CAMPEP_0119484510 /NCGR_PEP_ID=MMETSP1344-20130328/11501_1 /TAXON_ID=236787 /ORGANISM="Florenciella parvula, Strain CCMP2471" /LENGTH=109 /DNA_ID=CAMNT_0007519099 /DNA_START=110 /DNA_END=439 /DNA_ORIENTATION=-
MWLWRARWQGADPTHRVGTVALLHIRTVTKPPSEAPGEVPTLPTLRGYAGLVSALLCVGGRNRSQECPLCLLPCAAYGGPRATVGCTNPGVAVEGMVGGGEPRGAASLE